MDFSFLVLPPLHATLGHCKHDLTASVTFVDNKEWYEGWSLLDFISKLGRHFRVGTMLSRKSVRTRMESDEGLSFTEFFYQVQIESFFF